MAPLEALGFALAGYGCTTCIGNSGPLDESVAKAVEDERPRRRGGPVGQPQLRGPDPSAGAGELPRLAAARRRVRAGRPRRHRPDCSEPLGHGLGRPRRLCSPTSGRSPRRSAQVIGDSIDPELFRRTYAVVFEGDDRWRALPIPSGDRYAWDAASTYIAKPPFFDGLPAEAPRRSPTSRTPASSPSSATRSRPTTSRRPARSRRRRPPASGSRSTASARSSSTRTAPAAATTR